jgi:hypothetical protein
MPNEPREAIERDDMLGRLRRLRDDLDSQSEFDRVEALDAALSALSHTIVTDAMVEAGRDAWDSNMGCNPANVVRAIYTAMEAARLLPGSNS